MNGKMIGLMIRPACMDCLHQSTCTFGVKSGNYKCEKKTVSEKNEDMIKLLIQKSKGGLTQ